MADMHTPLKPCPHCNSKAEVTYNGPTLDQIKSAVSWGEDVDWQFYGECTACNSTGPGCQSESEAAAAWNRRAPSQDAETIKALRAELVQQHANVQHWLEDVRGNLKPLESSLETALASISASLSASQKEQA